MDRFGEFELQIRAAQSGSDDYVIDVNSSAGPASGRMKFNRSEAPLTDLLPKIMSAGEDLAARVQFGSLLFERAISANQNVLVRWTQSLTAAENAGERLRVRLRLEAPELAELPWELLRADDFLATSASVILGRYLPNAEPPPLVTSGKARVLVLIEKPENPSIQQDVIDGLESVLNQTAGFEKATVLINASLTTINAELWNGYHVVHYIGHGASDRILFVEGAETKIKSAVEFAALFSGQREVRLVVLNVCGSGQTAERGLFTGFGPLLSQQRIPAVVGMQYEKVLQSTARRFNEAFYRALSQSHPVDLAVNAARQALRAEAQDSRDWSTPVLYMSTRNGRILEFVADEDTVQARQVKVALESAPELTEAYDELIKLVEQTRAWTADIEFGLQLRRQLYDLRARANNTLNAFIDQGFPSSLVSSTVAAWKSVRNDVLPQLGRQVNGSSVAERDWWKNLQSSLTSISTDLPQRNFGSVQNAAAKLDEAIGDGIAEIDEAVDTRIERTKSESATALARFKPR